MSTESPADIDPTAGSIDGVRSTRQPGPQLGVRRPYVNAHNHEYPVVSPPAPQDARPLGAVCTFHPRRGRLSATRRELIERLWHRFGVDLPDHGAGRPPQPLDLAALFGNGVPVVLEVGFGMGEATAAMAAADPGTGILAVDVHTPGVGSLISACDAAGLRNVRVYTGDAVALLRDHLAPQALTGIRVFFPDPWPKSRHHKRRLISAPFARLVADRLVPGRGTLHCATDWAPYAMWMREVLDGEPLLDGGVVARPEWRPVTKFERQGVANGHTVTDLVYRRRP